MLYLWSNLGAWAAIIILFWLAMAIDRKAWKQYHINDLVLIALLVSLAVVLTNVISYNFTIFSQTIRLALGAFVIFVAGMLFGPFYGAITGLAADTIGLLAGIKGSYSALFTLDSVLYGFVGSLVWVGGFNKWWVIKTVCLYALTLAVVSFGIDIFWVYSFLGSSGIVASLPIKAIKIGPEIVIYAILALVSFSVIYDLMIIRSYHPVWATERAGQIRLFRFSDFKKIFTAKSNQSS